jgi:hypothetical protein
MDERLCRVEAQFTLDDCMRTLVVCMLLKGKAKKRNNNNNDNSSNSTSTSKKDQPPWRPTDTSGKPILRDDIYLRGIQQKPPRVKF